MELRRPLATLGPPILLGAVRSLQGHLGSLSSAAFTIGDACVRSAARRDHLTDGVPLVGHAGDGAAGHELHIVGVSDDESPAV